jgi:hypothetical protein
MKILTIGACPLCKKNIWKFKRPSFLSKTIYGWSINFKNTPYELNELGTHFWLLLSDGTRMRVAICKDCLKHITGDQVKQIFADITYTKLKAIEKDKRINIQYKLFDRVRTIEIVTYAENEQDIINFIESKV